MVAGPKAQAAVTHKVKHFHPTTHAHFRVSEVLSGDTLAVIGTGGPVRNFRSHEALLRVPNKLFYESELVSCAEESLRNFCCGHDFEEEPLATRGLPLVFHGIVCARAQAACALLLFPLRDSVF
eukprot:1175651-Prorocentrum_minimum.AAC.1